MLSFMSLGVSWLGMAVLVFRPENPPPPFLWQPPPPLWRVERGCAESRTVILCTAKSLKSLLLPLVWKWRAPRGPSLLGPSRGYTPHAPEKTTLYTAGMS
jgi:hypothetical protein